MPTKTCVFNFNIENRKQKTEDGLSFVALAKKGGLSGYQKIRMKDTSRPGNQKKPPRCPDNLMPTTWLPDLLMVSFIPDKDSVLQLRLRRTSVENVRQINFFLQNKANFRKSQMDVSLITTRNYEKKSKWTFGENKPKQSQLPPAELGAKSEQLRNAHCRY